jgi:hypothetical protein
MTVERRAGALGAEHGQVALEGAHEQASPAIPLTVIIAAAKTMSRASVEVSSPPETMSVTISPTSITVAANARISAPYGSPTRWAPTPRRGARPSRRRR